MRVYAGDKNTIEGSWWHWLDDEHKKIQCDLCPRACQVIPGKRGFCFVRKGSEQGMLLTSYGKSSGFCIDPIEKKPLNHFYPGSSVLSFGTVGCNLGCQFCQNWDISKVRKQERLLDEATPERIAEAAKAGGCKSVAFTYNDPIIFAEYAIDTAKACHDMGVKTVAVTAGYVNPEARKEFFQHMDAVNVDLKAFTEEFYKKNSLAHLAPVLDTLKYIVHETDVWLEVTTLLIPGQNDSEDEIRRMTEWLVKELSPDVPLHFSAFHPDFRMKDIPNTPASTLSMARCIAMQGGMKYVYTGNVHDPEGGSTWCSSCGEVLLERDWYRLGAFNIRDGKCKSCGTAVAGHFEEKAGGWGPKRQPVSLQASDNDWIR